MTFAMGPAAVACPAVQPAIRVGGMRLEQFFITSVFGAGLPSELIELGGQFVALLLQLLRRPRATATPKSANGDPD